MKVPGIHQGNVAGPAAPLGGGRSDFAPSVGINVGSACADPIMLGV